MITSTKELDSGEGKGSILPSWARSMDLQWPGATRPAQLRTKGLRKKPHDHRHSQPCFLPEHCIKELVFMDSMINPKPGEGERGTNLGGSTPNEG